MMLENLTIVWEDNPCPMRNCFDNHPKGERPCFAPTMEQLKDDVRKLAQQVYGVVSVSIVTLDGIMLQVYPENRQEVRLVLTTLLEVMGYRVLPA